MPLPWSPKQPQNAITSTFPAAGSSSRALYDKVLHILSIKDEGCKEEEPLVQYSAIYGNPALSIQPEKESPPPGSLPSPKTVFFSQTPAHHVHLVPNHHSTPKKAPPAAYMSKSEIGGDSSVYSEPLLGYEDISYSTLELDCGAEDDISTLAD